MGGARSTKMNGWYRRFENAEGPPMNWRYGNEIWARMTAGRPWFQTDGDHDARNASAWCEDGGCFIHWNSRCKMWWCRDGLGLVMYEHHSDADLPPRNGWRVHAPSGSPSFCSALLPAPTLQHFSEQD